MTIAIRNVLRALLVLVLISLAACDDAEGDSDPERDHGHSGEDGGSESGGVGGSRNRGGSGGAAGAIDGGESSPLARPGRLPRPPRGGFPSELRPPR